MATQSRTKSTNTPTKRKTNGSAKLAQDPNARIIKSDEDPSVADMISDTAQAAKDKASELTDQVADSVRSYGEAGKEHTRKLAAAGQQGAKTIEAQVRDNPMLAVGAAFGLGVALALLLKPKN